MKLQELIIHSNKIGTEGFSTLMMRLKSNNKIRFLNISRNNIADNLKKFKTVQKFLTLNKTLEVLNLSHCNLDEFTGAMIGRGLRGNRNLQSLILKGNPIKEGVLEIAKAFIGNKIALCIKELDLSKCQIHSEDITSEFFTMIKSTYTTLKTLNLRENFIKPSAGEQILEALKVNKTLTKVNLDYNPIS